MPFDKKDKKSSKPTVVRKLTTELYHPPAESRVAKSKGPQALDQINALITDQYWTVLGAKHLSCKAVNRNITLCINVNAFKHALQTYGPQNPEQLPDFRNAVGRANGHIFHGHVSDSNGKEYILEWTIVDPVNKIMAIVGFGIHENYRFKTEALQSEELNSILNNSNNIKIQERVAQLKQEAKAKADKIIFARP